MADKTTNSVDVTDYQQNIDKAEADRLLGEAAGEFFERVSQGEQPSVDEYANRYPQIADLIRDTFAAVQFIDRSTAGVLRGGADDQSDQKSIGDFRIIREIGRGGMGVVYEAEQLSLGRSVALKVLPYAAMLDQKAIIRFKNEARAAATLDHPNIVPVHAVGNERGIYYYAMSLIDGLTLADFIGQLKQNISDDENANAPLSFDGLVGSPRKSSSILSNLEQTIDSGRPTMADADQASQSAETSHRDLKAAISTHRSRFNHSFFRSAALLGVQAAEALEHAHQHGIVHRDIKPGNLIIDSASKLWITDFGLARIESEARLTMTGDMVGTLRYMAPEQALAKRVVVDHRADIYALGATLYELLALQPVFEGLNREELIKQIAFDEAKPLRSLNAQVPIDLQTIIQKSLSKNPDERYQSAQEMADDLHAYSNEEPITARPLSVTQRAVRWSSKRKGLVASIAGVLMLALVGLSISNAVIAHERNAARAAKDKERAQRMEAETQRKEAERQRQKADENFRNAQEAVDTYLTKVSENELLEAPGLQALRQDLLELALKYYQGFVETHGNDPELKAELAASYSRVGSIQSLLGGHREALLLSAQQALRLREALLEADATNLVLRADRARSLRQVGKQQIALGKSKDAEAPLRAALALARELADEYPDNRDYQAQLAETYGVTAYWHTNMGQFDELVIIREKTFRIWQRLASQDAEYADQLAVSVVKLVNAMRAKRESGDVTRAFVTTQTTDLRRLRERPDVLSDSMRIQRAVQSLERLATADPTPERQFQLATVYHRAADSMEDISKLEMVESAIQIVKPLVELNPTVPDYKLALALYQIDLSVQHRVNRNLQQADQAHASAVELLKELVRQHPSVARYTLTLAHAYQKSGFHGSVPAGGKMPNASITPVPSAGTLDERIAAHQEAIEIYRELVTRDPGLLEYKKMLAESYRRLGFVLYKEDPKAALVAFRECATMRQAIVSEQPWRRNVFEQIFCRIDIGDALQELKSEDAWANWEMARSELESLASTGPYANVYRSYLKDLCQGRAQFRIRSGDNHAAIPWLQSAVAAIEKQFIDDDALCYDLAHHLTILARSLRAAGEGREAAANDRRAILCLTYAIELASDGPPLLLADLHQRRAKIYEGLEQPEESLADFLRAAQFLDAASANGRDDTNRLLTNAQVHFLVGNALHDADRHAESVKAFAKSADLLLSIPENDRSTGLWGKLGQALSRAERYAEALQAFERSLDLRGETQPTNRFGPRWWYMVSLYARNGSPERARSIYDQLTKELQELPPTVAASNEKFRAEAAQALGLETPTLAATKDAVQITLAQSESIDPAFLEFLENVIEEKERLLSDWLGTPPSRRRLERVHAELAHQYALLARVRSRSGSHAMAVAALERSIEVCNERIAGATRGEDADANIAAWYQQLLGSFYRQLSASQRNAGNDVAAEQSLKWAKAADAKVLPRLLAIPDDERTPKAWEDLGAALYKEGQYAEARGAIEMNLELSGETVPTVENGPRWWYLTMLLARKGDLEKAKSYYDVLAEELEQKAEPNRATDERLRSQLEGLLGVP